MTPAEFESIMTCADPVAKDCAYCAEKGRAICNCPTVHLGEGESVSFDGHCQCNACRGGILHASDCSVHNEPAYRNGLCDCGTSKCWCETCRPHSVEMRMILCPDCGNKRCPKARNHENPCTGSNAVGQKPDASRARAHVLPPVRFIVPGQPVPKGRAKFARRGNFVQTYTPEKTASYESLVRYTAAAAMGAEKPFDGPVRVSLDITLAIPASWSKKRQTMALHGDIAATKKPDADNVLKAIKDGMNGIVYVDDAQVVEISVTKRYGAKPGVSVIVGRINRERA